VTDKLLHAHPHLISFTFRIVTTLLLFFRPPAFDLQAELRKHRFKDRKRLERQQQLLEGRAAPWLQSTGPAEFRDSDHLKRTLQEYADWDLQDASGDLDSDEYT
jgi:hypothetical protein